MPHANNPPWPPQPSRLLAPICCAGVDVVCERRPSVNASPPVCCASHTAARLALRERLLERVAERVRVGLAVRLRVRVRVRVAVALGTIASTRISVVVSARS